MKCDQLKAYGMADPAIDDEYEMYKVTEVDEAIAELKAENRRMKRALYKACANWAMNARMVEIEAKPWGENHESHLWAGVYDKCLKKVEEHR